MHWDVFCHVVDNLGDIGVCWRLARQLAGEHGLAVRLWVDDLAAFRELCPEIRPDLSEQTVQGIEIRRWEGDFAGAIPADVVVETFGCRLPDAFEAAMARRDSKPVWVNLDHLCAENWVAAYHARPSPHPRLPITKYFFFPGFSGHTGGLLREKNLERDRLAFAADPDARGRFLAGLGVPAQASADTLTVSLFSYENAALDALLDAWSHSARPVRALVPSTRRRADVERFAQCRLEIGQPVRVGNLELCATPFVPPPDYDRLLWCGDLNFVRGEDSFVRAQWAGKPMVWNIYAQSENAHHAKLDAFLDLYAAGLPAPRAALLRKLFLAWNGIGVLTRALWERWADGLPEWRRHAAAWREKLAEERDLCSRLVQFCQSRL